MEETVWKPKLNGRILKQILERMWIWFDFLTMGLVASFYEHANQPSGYIKVENFLSSQITVSCSRNTLHHEVNYFLIKILIIHAGKGRRERKNAYVCVCVCVRARARARACV